MSCIYLDNAATTALSPGVLDAMMPYLTRVYGNPSSLHAAGRESRAAIERARSRVEQALSVRSGRIFFTSGGTEADNWAVLGGARAMAHRGRHIITSAIEHHAVLAAAHRLEREGCTVTFLPVDDRGLVSVEAVREAVRPDTALISVMMANNEVGTLQPIREIGELAREQGILMHTDGVQALGNLPIDLSELPVDLLSLSGHKINGPKGVGALYVGKGAALEALLLGGAQERGQRAGTENVPAIVGMGEAVVQITADIDARAAHIEALRNFLLEEIRARIPGVRLNGHPEKRLPGILNLCVEGIRGEALLPALDLKGLAASSGAACTAGSPDPSHVLLAMGLSREQALASLRFSLGEDNTAREMQAAARILEEVVAQLRTF